MTWFPGTIDPMTVETLEDLDHWARERGHYAGPLLRPIDRTTVVGLRWLLMKERRDQRVGWGSGDPCEVGRLGGG